MIRLPRGHEALVTTDFSLEDVHFRRAWHPADAVGHRCLTRGLSDIAAMGGMPRAAFLSLAVPADLPQRWIDEFIRGLLHLADRYDVLLAGGDTAQSPGGILADIVVLGSVPAGKAVLRSGARPGDLLYVTGTLGSSSRSLERIAERKEARPNPIPNTSIPSHDIAVGRYLAREEAGYSDDRHQRRTLYRPGATSVRRVKPAPWCTPAVLPARRGQSGLALALHGGEEYELLFTAPPNRQVPKKIAGVADHSHWRDPAAARDEAGEDGRQDRSV